MCRQGLGTPECLAVTCFHAVVALIPAWSPTNLRLIDTGTILLRTFVSISLRSARLPNGWPPELEYCARRVLRCQPEAFPRKLLRPAGVFSLIAVSRLGDRV